MSNNKFSSAITKLQDDFRTLHTHQANPSQVENILVEAYGAKMQLQELAAISVPEANVLIIQPWDKSVVLAVQAALRQNELNLNPVVDGDRLRIIFPPLTTEKRQDLVKLVHKKMEEARIQVRQVREELVKEIKQQKKDKFISEDDYWRQEKEIQQKVNEANEAIDQMGKKKELELMNI